MFDPATQAVLLGLLSPDMAARDAAVAAAFELPEDGLAVVSAAEARLTSWRSLGHLSEGPGRCVLRLYQAPDPLTSWLISALPLTELSCAWASPHILGARPDLALTTLPVEWLPETLEVLGLPNHRLTHLPPHITKLRLLRRLNLAWNALVDLPGDFSALTGLVELHIQGNSLTELPSDFGRLTRLEHLDAGANQLGSLPDSVGGLTALRTLKLGNNQLTGLPPGFTQLAALATLDLSNNLLEALPADLGCLTALTELDLLGNALTALPDTIGELAALRRLTLAQNRLEALPPGIGRLRIEHLSVAHNQLSGLPDEVADLPLYGLNLAHNPLRSLPRRLEQMTKRLGEGSQGNASESPSQLNAIALDQSGLDEDTKRWLHGLRIDLYEEDPDDD